MSDLIERQAAIDAAVTFVRRTLLDSKPIDVKMSSDYIFVNLVEPMRKLPTAQPETNCSEFPNNSDTISRQAAIDAIDRITRTDNWQAAVSMALMDLPSAQPSFDITVKIDKAYDDGYEAGYLQGRHDWGDLDE